MKKIFLVCCVFIFVLTSMPYASAQTYLKIGLKYGNSAVTQCTISSESGLNSVVGGVVVLPFDTKKIMLKVSENIISIYNEISEVPLYTYDNSQGIFEIGSANGIIAINDISYRGTLFFSEENNKIKVINYVELEDYLKSVVPSEMPGSWNIEALKAQTVCARNYALNNIGKYNKQGFDMDDTTANQAYKGTSVEYPNSTKAVMETAGKTLMYNNSLAQTFFYSSSGGKTEDVKNVWGSNIAYLVSVDDPYEGNVSSWEKKFTQEELKQRLLSLKIDVGDIISIEVTKRTPSNRAIETIIKGTKGQYVAKLENTRNVFALKSAMYEVTSTISSAPNIGDVITSKGVEQREIESSIITKNGIMPYTPPSKYPSSFTFKGQGNGHGVGMSQYGAKGFAQQGYTYDKILQHYFPSTTLN